MPLQFFSSLPPWYLSPVAMCAPGRSEYPVFPLHGATCWLGVLIISLLNVMWDISACSEMGTNNMNRGRVYTGVCAYIFERTYMLIFL